MNHFTKPFFIINLCIIFGIYTSFSIENKKSKHIKTRKPVSPQAYDEIIFEMTRTFAQVVELTKEKHFQITDPQEAMNKAIDAFVSSLDPHSGYLELKTYKSMMDSTSGEFHGIGVVINNTRKTKDKFLTIVETIPGGPAEKAGMIQYDKIIEIEGKSLEGMTTEEATILLKGKKGTSVNIKVIREGAADILPFTITRDIIKEQQSLCFYLPEKDIYYLSLTMFAENSAQQLEQLLKKANEKDYKGLILDLRNNSGGLLSSALDIAGLFLEKGSVIATTKDNTLKVTETYATSRNPIMNHNIPICILINNYTASAAEILAGSLKIHASKTGQKKPIITILVGTTTFGKGSVQEVIPLGNDTALKLTTSLYFLPEDTAVQGIGISPDIMVERCTPPNDQSNWVTEFYGRENTLENHITITQPKDDESKEATPIKSDDNLTWNERMKRMLQKDNQLKEAINVLSIVSNARQNIAHLIIDRTSALLYLQKNYVNQNTITIQEVKL